MGIGIRLPHLGPENVLPVSQGPVHTSELSVGIGVRSPSGGRICPHRGVVFRSEVGSGSG